MTPRSSVLITALSCFAAILSQPAVAQPAFNTTLVDLICQSGSDSTTDGVITDIDDIQNSSSNGFSVLVAGTGITGPNGGTADSAAAHQFSIGAYSISGAFFATGEAFGVQDSSTLLGSRAVNEGELRFTLSEDARVLVQYDNLIETSGSSFFSGGDGLGQLVVNGTRPDGSPFTLSRLNLGLSDGGASEISGAPILEIKGGTEVVLTYQMSAFAGVIFPENHFANNLFTFSLDVLDDSGDPNAVIDSDDDGIPDDWEENGIDVDGDGTIDIDLPGIVAQYGGGAIPGDTENKKTLFVELDAHDGVPVDMDAIAAVVQAFADAPINYYDNETGELKDYSGIDLIVVVDDTNLTNEEYDGTGWPQAFDDAKASFFGTAAMRAQPNWETELEPVYRKIFRYGIWGQAMFRTEDDGNGGTNKVYFSGKAELPGNDFFVAAGDIASWYDNRPELRTDALAGTLMHEFGHNLDLRHGGHENKNYKPNYLSVMNYAYQLPNRRTSPQGTDLSDAWFLDYAGTEPMVLNETQLREDQGFDGPANRSMLFNVAAGDDPRELVFVDADASEIDWDFSQTPIQTEPVSANLTRFRLDIEDDDLDNQLVALSDWDRIWYRVGGAPDFADGSHTSVEELEELSFNEFEQVQALVINDFTTPNCEADLNGDGILDLGDIGVFVDLFLAGELAADFNGDGFLDIGDIGVYVDAFLEGC